MRLISPIPHPKQPYIWPLLLLILADSAILLNAPLFIRYSAALALLLFLPGWLWTIAFFKGGLSLPARLALTVGLSLSITVITAMVAVYWPGPIQAERLLIALNGVIGLGAAAVWFKRSETPVVKKPLRRQWVGLLLLVLLAAALRLPRLGYAEFHEDEAEALMLGVRLFQGEDYALFLHRKGPAQMLAPVAVWLLTGRLTEAMGRFPFALSSIFSVVTLFLLGRRWFATWQAGAVAALLWAINGYAIGFGRMVQYQALIFFLGPLAIYCLFLARQLRQPKFQIPAAIFLAVSLLAHFDALLLLPAAGYLLLAGYRTAPDRRRATLILGLSLSLFLLLLAAFYIPYILDPEFQNTTTYLAESRVKPGLLYNNLDLLRRLDRDYSSHFYLPLLAAGIAALLVARAGVKSRGWFFTTTATLGLAASTFWLPEWWQVEPLSLAPAAWLLLLIIGFWTASTVEQQAAWLLFGVPLIGYGFLVDDPRTHLYIAYPGAALLSGAGWAALPARRWVAPLPAAGALAAAAVMIYVIAIFLQTESNFTALRTQWDGSPWETVYNDLPQAREYFGYPKREGWKAIGALRAAGRFPGDFRSVNEEFIIPIWYNFGQARSCYETPAHFFVRLADLETPVNNPDYQPTGAVTREGETRLEIFSRNAAIKPEIYPLAQFIGQFDQLTTPEQFARQSRPSQPVSAQFGPAIQFSGYDISSNQVSPGETLIINLYWQALGAPAHRYRAFVHLTDGVILWAQQDDDPACRLPTSIWRAGQHAMGQFRLPLSPDTPPGRYPLIIGLYDSQTLERLPITAGAGQIGDNFLWLGDIEITENPGFQSN